MKTTNLKYNYLITLFLYAFSLNALSAGNNLSFMKLKPCPGTPNCVSSQSLSAEHKIEPIPFKTSGTDAIDRIKSTILAMSNTRLIKEEGNYLHIEFKTQFLKYIDDVEIVVDETEKLIHIRSASRDGYWDLGANRRRVNKIREKFLD